MRWSGHPAAWWTEGTVLVVGLTGGIASGKSTVARRLAELGAVVVDADALARAVLAPGTPGLAAVAEEFGADLVVDGSLDRAALGRIVFVDPIARARLEAIVHPAVQAAFAARVAAAPPDAVVVHDVPLLTELGLGPRYHLVVVVHAEHDVRRARLVQQRHISVDDAEARIAAQSDDRERRAVADIWLDNTRARYELFIETDSLWKHRLVPYEENVRLRRRVRRAERVELLPHDPSWAPAAARIAGRIRWSIRDHPAAACCTVEHIGSTAVPGLPAKDVLDLQLGVPSLGVADELEPALSAAGWIRLPGNNRDNPKTFDPDPDHWAKRFYGGTDPAVVVHLHVRALGSPGWRYALLFRDWLRADPAARAEYESAKRAVAAANGDAATYAEAKEPWFDAAWPRARAWAEATGWQPAT